MLKLEEVENVEKELQKLKSGVLDSAQLWCCECGQKEGSEWWDEAEWIRGIKEEN